MAVKIGHATSDENRKLHGGKAGDQSKKEVFIRDWYNRPWTHVIEFVNPDMAEKAATCMEKACANNHIGYDQYQRNTLLTESRKYGYDPSKVTKNVETDCSALVSLCCMYAGIPESVLYRNGNSATTSTLRSRLESTGQVHVYTASKYLKSGEYNHRGAILLYEGHHVAIQLTDGSKAEKLIEEVDELKDTNTTVKEQDKTVPYLAVVNAGKLNVRAGSGIKYKSIAIYKYGTPVIVTKVEGNWGYVNDTGWVSLAFTTKKTEITGKVTASLLNVRKSAVNGSVLKTIKKDTKVSIINLNDNGSWGYDSIAKGWVSLKYIKF